MKFTEKRRNVWMFWRESKMSKRFGRKQKREMRAEIEIKDREIKRYCVKIKALEEKCSVPYVKTESLILHIAPDMSLCRGAIPSMDVACVQVDLKPMFLEMKMDREDLLMTKKDPKVIAKRFASVFITEIEHALPILFKDMDVLE